MINQQDVAKLLGRPLSSKETASFEEYIDIAKEDLEELLGIKIEKSEEDPSERTFDQRDGYRSLYVDPFTSITSIEIGDEDPLTGDDYHVAQNDLRNAPWYNTIVFKERMCSSDDLVTVNATWGFGQSLPKDLQLLLARMFMVVANVDTSGKDKVRSKSIEDFSVTYDLGKTTLDRFYEENRRIIRKYRQLPVGDIAHGCV